MRVPRVSTGVKQTYEITGVGFHASDTRSFRTVAVPAAEGEIGFFGQTIMFPSDDMIDFKGNGTCELW